MDFDQREPMDVDRAGPRMKSTVHTAQGRNIKGRGQNQGNDRMVGDFERLEDAGHHEESTAQKSIDGWVVFVTNLHEEATTEDLQDAFCEFGEVRNSWMNLDRQTGYVKGYALVEYRTKDEAEAAIEGLDGSKFLDREIRVSWAFVKPPARAGMGGRRR